MMQHRVEGDFEMVSQDEVDDVEVVASDVVVNILHRPRCHKRFCEKGAVLMRFLISSNWLVKGSSF